MGKIKLRRNTRLHAMARTKLGGVATSTIGFVEGFLNPLSASVTPNLHLKIQLTKNNLTGIIHHFLKNMSRFKKYFFIMPDFW